MKAAAAESKATPAPAPAKKRASTTPTMAKPTGGKARADLHVAGSKAAA
jgi:hypothetical protein